MSARSQRSNSRHKRRLSVPRWRRLLVEQFETRSLLATLTNTGTAADIVYTLPAAAGIVFLEDDGISGNGLLQLRSYNGTFDTTVFANPTGSLTINPGNGGGSLKVNDLSADFNAGLTIGAAGSEFSSVLFAGRLTLAANKSLSANAINAISLQNSSAKLATS